MLLRHIYHDQLSQASYLIGSGATGEALVVDPHRDPARYEELAAREGLRIAAVTETHIHADFVSGARELAARTGARLYLSGAGPAEWQYRYAAAAGATLLRDGDSFMIGDVRITALHVPGHTPEHLAFLVTDTAGADQPMGICTGDLVFVGDVGRPDLLEKVAGIGGTMDAGARDLFRSLQRLRSLPEYLQIWPGHGAGSPCGRALGAVPQSTVGYELRFNWAFGITDEEQFVQAVLAGQPDPPLYFAQMKRVNRDGPALLTQLPAPPERIAAELRAALADGMLVVDTRSADEFAARHAPGTINLPLGGGFVTWAGWLLPYDRPVGLIVAEARRAEALHLLRLIGLDQIAGLWTPEMAVGATLGRIAVAELARQTDAGPFLLDVRGVGEYAEGHIAGSHHIPLGHLSRRLAEIPADRAVVVICQSGARSAIGASMLAATGRREVSNLIGGIGAWRAARLPLEQAPPPGALVEEYNDA